MLASVQFRLKLLDSFFIIAFASYVESQTDFSQTFFEWLQVWFLNPGWYCVIANRYLKEPNRDLEVSERCQRLPVTDFFASQIKFLRTTYGSRLNVFAPINDLSSLSKGGIEVRGFSGAKNNVTLAGGQILGDEYSDHVVRVFGLSQFLIARDTHIGAQNRSGIILREG